MSSVSSRIVRLAGSGYLAPINGLVSPNGNIDAFKSSLFTARRRFPDPAKNQVYQDLVAKTLGFRDWGDFKNVGWGKLRDFMGSHDMSQHHDLVDANLYGGLRYRIRQVADRLFLGGERVTRLYTAAQVKPESQWFIGKRNVASDPSPALATSRLKEAVKSGDAARCMAVLDDTDLYDVDAVANFLGTLLIDGNGVRNIVRKVFWPGGKVPPEHKAYYEALGECFAAAIRGSDEGWVDVLRFNESIAFLKGRDGSFDIVCRSARDTTEEPYEIPDLLAEVPPDYRPSAMSGVSAFTNWFDRQTDLWEEQLRFEAESWYYAEGHTAKTYPGPNELLEGYLRHRGDYCPKAASHARSEHFVRVELPGRRAIHVSREPITAQEFNAFMAASPGWANLRTGADLSGANDGAHDGLSASMTYFDAVAYCKHVEQETGLPVRLLQVREMRDIVRLTESEKLSGVLLDHGREFCEWLLKGDAARWRGPGQVAIGEMPPHEWGPRERRSTGGMPELAGSLRVGARVCFDAE